MGLRTLLLTGDSSVIAEAVGKQLGVDEVGAGMLPEQKLDRVKALMTEGRRVVMVTIATPRPGAHAVRPCRRGRV